MTEEVFFITGGIYLVISIVILVKFFQIATDIKYLKEKALFENDSFDFLIANGFNEEAKRRLLKMVWNDELMSALRKRPNKKTYDLYYSKLKEKYNNKFTRLGEDFPTYDNLIQK